jgi:hypothetical protein
MMSVMSDVYTMSMREHGVGVGSLSTAYCLSRTVLLHSCVK